jgi:hypothetical protein
MATFLFACLFLSLLHKWADLWAYLNDAYLDYDDFQKLGEKIVPVLFFPCAIGLCFVFAGIR